MSWLHIESILLSITQDNGLSTYHMLIRRGFTVITTTTEPISVDTPESGHHINQFVCPHAALIFFRSQNTSSPQKCSIVLREEIGTVLLPDISPNSL